MMISNPNVNNLIKKDREDISDNVRYVFDNWKRANVYHGLSLDTCIENFRYYWAKHPELGFGQWPIDAVCRMTQQGRQLTTYNFVRPTIDGIAGSILQIPFDPDFLSVNGETDDFAKSMKKVMYSDKEIMNWKTTMLELVTHGLIHEGVIKMIVSTEWNELGNIGFATCLPGTVIFDPYWKDFSSKTCRKCWKESWLTPQAAMAVWPEWKDRLEFEVKRQKRTGDQYGSNMGITPYTITANEWGSQQRFIEEYEVVEISKKCEYLMMPNGDDIPIPEMPEDKKPEWLNTYVPEWDASMICERDEKEKVCMVRTVCPSLVNDELIQNAPTEIQIGRLPFFPWSATRLNGEISGQVDALKDAQMNLNYGVALAQWKLQTEGGGGAQFVDETMFKTHEEFLRYCKHRNRALANFELKPGYLDKGIVPSRPVQKSPFPAEAYESVNHIIDKIWPNISKRPPTSFGRPEPGNETSGRLFELMKIQSDTMIYTINYGLRQFWNDIYEAYLIQAGNTYSNELIPRDFWMGKEKVTLNEPVVYPNGMSGIKNDARLLKKIRYKVIISETQESPTEKMYNVGILSEYMSRLSPNAVGTLAVVQTEIAKNIDQFSKESKAKIEETSEMEYSLAKETLALQIATARSQRMMIEQQMSNMQQQQQGMALPPQSGSPEQISQARQGSPAPQPAGENENLATSLNQPRPKMAGGGFLQ